MATTNNASFSFRLSDSLKAQSFEVIEKYGLTPSQAINMFLTQVARTHTVPVDLSYLQSDEPVFNYDLERMKDRVENQEFVSCPDDIQTPAEFRQWLSEVASS